jgi:MFS family permease
MTAEAARVDLRGIAAAIGGVTIVGIVIGLGMPLLSIVMENRSYSAGDIGTNTAISGLAALAAAPLATPIAMRFGVARTLIASMLVSAAAFSAFYPLDGFWVWALLRFVLSFAVTLVFILSEFWITSAAPPDRRGFVLGLYATVLSLGFAAGPLIFAWTGSGGFLPFGIAVVIMCLAIMPVLAARDSSPAIASGELRPFAPFLFAAPAATGAALLFGSVDTAIYSLLPIHATGLGIPEQDAALLLTAMGLGNVLLQVPIGQLSDKLRDRRTLLLALAIFGVAGSAAIAVAGTNWLFLAAVMLTWGGSIAGLYTVGLAHLGARFSGADLASANAAFVFCHAIGMLLGPLLTGIAIEQNPSIGFPSALAVFFFVIGALIAARMARVQR